MPLLSDAEQLARLVAFDTTSRNSNLRMADFKDRFGLTRKWAIPLLEHLDSTGATRRMGDDRMVVRTAGA